MADDNPQQSQDENVIDPIELFTPAVREVVTGLSYLGRVTDTFKLAGHKFGLQTLRPEYRYAIAQVIQPYRNTLYEDKIWRNAHIGVSLTHVDGKADFCDAIGPDITDFVRGRLSYISDRDTGWYEPVLEFLWYNYQLLEVKASKAIEQLNFLSQESHQQTFLQGLEEILRETASFPEETDSVSPPPAPSSEF